MLGMGGDTRDKNSNGQSSAKDNSDQYCQQQSSDMSG